MKLSHKECAYITEFLCLISSTIEQDREIFSLIYFKIILIH